MLFPETTAALETFSSGSALLVVGKGGRLFVLTYSPSGGFGVDEVLEGEAFDSGYRFVSKDVDAAVEELHRLLQATLE